MAEPFELTIADIGTLFRQRRLSPVELMESLLSRATSMEPSLNVWVTLDPDEALAAARRSEREMTESGHRGPLHGIPVGVKDIYYTEGVKTTGGSPIYADFVPDYDSTPVALLKAAGAIMMGKTVTTQFACGDPPPTRNPWNAGHTPGGSSSGSAVGMAVRQFPAALGSQTAGSVLRPASYNGVVGLKPSFGRISRYGVMPVSWSLDTVGTFTRTVKDAALMLSVLAGHDAKDFSSSALDVPDYAKALDSGGPPPRIGVVRRFFYDAADAEVRDHTDQIVRQLTDAGAVVDEARVETDFETLLAAHRLITTSEAAAVHEANFTTRPDDYAPDVRGVIEAGMIAPAVRYVQAQRTRRRFRRDMEEAVREYDVLLSPSTPTPAPADVSTTGPPKFQTPWTTCGFPAITLPSGLSKSGLPLGVQLASGPFGEETLLAAAHWAEQVLGVNLTPPAFG